MAAPIRTPKTDRDADIAFYFRHVEYDLDHLDDGLKATYINHQIERFERFEARLEAWAMEQDGPHPFKAPLDAFICTTIMLRLRAKLDAVEERIRRRIAAANAVIAELGITA